MRVSGDSNGWPMYVDTAKRMVRGSNHGWKQMAGYPTAGLEPSPHPGRGTPELIILHCCGWICILWWTNCHPCFWHGAELGAPIMDRTASIPREALVSKG